jgi:hypothetical protein
MDPGAPRTAAAQPNKPSGSVLTNVYYAVSAYLAPRSVIASARAAHLYVIDISGKGRSKLLKCGL